MESRRKLHVNLSAKCIQRSYLKLTLGRFQERAERGGNSRDRTNVSSYIFAVYLRKRFFSRFDFIKDLHYFSSAIRGSST